MDNLQMGIKAIYDMETSIYLMENAISELDSKIFSLGKRKSFSEPTEENTYADYEEYLGKSIAISVSVAIIISFINTIVTVNGILDVFSKLGKIISFLFWCFVIVVGFGFIFGIVLTNIKKSQEKNRKNQKYQSEYKSYLRKIDDDGARVKAELEEKRILILKRGKLYNKIKESEQLLKDMYLKSSIDKTYWGIIPIGYMNEFLRLQITDHFGGNDGLYYLVRNEIKSDRLQFTLDEINNKLDTIIDNQSRIFEELNSIRNRSNQMIRETVRMAEIASKNQNTLREIESNTALDAYYSQQAQAELKYMNDMNIIFNKWS